VEVSLPALRHNLREVSNLVGSSVSVCAIIKSDAYGHGAIGCGRALEHAGAPWLGISSPDEGVTLREAGIKVRILVLGGFWRGDEDKVVAHALTPAVWSAQHLELLDAAVARIQPGRRLPVHVKINTGMNRLGADVSDLKQLCMRIQSSSGLMMEGLFSHFSSSEVIDSPANADQLRGFGEALKIVNELGIKPVCHMANSAAIASSQQSWFDLVRPGLALFGYLLPPTFADGRRPESAARVALQPALQWKTRIVQLRELAAGEPIGYSGAWTTRAPSTVAVLSVGYGDGLSRRLSSRGRVIIRDSYAPIVGNVSMNLTTVDVSAIPEAAVGDEVTLIGATAGCRISAWEHAELCGTIPYEILCNISSRVPREYQL